MNIDRNDTIILIRFHMKSNYFNAVAERHEHVYGTTDEHQQVPAGGNTSVGVSVKPDADASKGSEGSFTVRVYNAVNTSYYFEMKYVCNDQQNNSFVVTPHDGFEVAIQPAPEVLKTAATFFVNIDITET